MPQRARKNRSPGSAVSLENPRAERGVPAGTAVPERRHRPDVNAVSNTLEEHAIDVLTQLAAEVADDPRVSGIVQDSVQKLGLDRARLTGGACPRSATPT